MATKVERLISRHGLRAVGDDLEYRWLGDGAESMSLRELADWFNKQLLRAHLDDVAYSYLPGEIDNLYRLLHGDGVSAGDEVQVVRTLEREGVDVDSIRDGFVSHQAIHTYLRQARGVENRSSAESPSTDDSIDRINRLLSRTTSVAEDDINRHRTQGTVAIGDFDVMGAITVTCLKCGRTYDIVDLLEAGSCACPDA